MEAIPRMSVQRILITGASGCVGHYIVEDLMEKTGHELVLVLRDPAKLAIRPEWAARISVIAADMEALDAYRDRLAGIDAAMLVATSWGEGNAFRINCDANTALADALIAAGCKRIVYFSSASVLDADGNLLDAARDLGSEYIQSKYRLVELMEERAGQADMIGMFPTLVVGADPGKPASHFAKLIRQVRPWAWLMRRLRADGRFHIIHARDIATVARIMLSRPMTPGKPERVVLGNPSRSVNEFAAEFLAHLGKRPGRSIELRETMAEALIKFFRIQLSPWDRYCMHHRDLSHRVAVNPAAFGEPVHAPDLSAALTSIGIARRG